MKMRLNKHKRLSLRTLSKKQVQVTAKKPELNDEEKEAKKVNEYLNNFFRHQFLRLEAKKMKDSNSI